MLRKWISDLWKDVNEACLRQLPAPMMVLERILHWFQSMSMMRWLPAPLQYQSHVIRKSSSKEESRQELAAAFFDWNIGKKNVRPQQPKHHDVDLPFPTSLLKTTFLVGKELKRCRVPRN
ncbi:hypothetical protein MLD38_003405 [Melastoma candidum]|uniref:Uncharacterized protein n=1 Tax=Melastoma candidum TaxID=119954 RepID=A0ACB9S6B4_9MYRT|nr:hypothetical protein MLD38_003405 [Melastoma candidum]